MHPTFPRPASLAKVPDPSPFPRPGGRCLFCRRAAHPGRVAPPTSTGYLARRGIMRTGLAITVVLAAGLPLAAADLRPPDTLPHYDFAIRLDVAGHQAHVVQRATWTNTGKKPV